MASSQKETRLKDRERHRADHRQHPLLLLRLRLAIRVWSILIPIFARSDDLSKILQLAAPGKHTRYDGLGSETIWRCCHRAVKRPLLMNDRPCLREGLLVYRFLVMAGFSPTLHFGVDRHSVAENAVRAHLWVRLGERVFNPPEPTMVEIHARSHRDADKGAHQVA